MAEYKPDSDHTVVMGQGEQPMTAGPDAFFKAPKAKLVCLDDSALEGQQGLVISLDGAEKILGRDKANSAPIHHSKISRQHARVFPMAGRWAIEDLGSVNGVFVNDVRVAVKSASPLKPGDYVRIGTVPFRFVLERPESLAMAMPSPGEGSEKTVMFGGLSGDSAAGMLMTAEEDAKKPEVEIASKTERPGKVEKIGKSERPQPMVRPVLTSTPGSVSVGRRQSEDGGRGGQKIGIAVAVLLLVGGGAFYYINANSGGKKEVAAIQHLLKDYRTNYEDPTSTATGAVEALQSIQNQTIESVAAYPINPELKELKAQVLLFQLERQVSDAVHNRHAIMAFKSVEAALTEVSKLKDPKAKGKVDDILAVITLAREVVFIKVFQERYPTPSAQAQVKPSRNDIKTYQVSRDKFMELKRNSTTDELLKIQYLLLGRLVIDMDQEDLPHLDPWVTIVQGST